MRLQQIETTVSKSNKIAQTNSGQAVNAILNRGRYGAFNCAGDFVSTDAAYPARSCFAFQVHVCQFEQRLLLKKPLWCRKERANKYELQFYLASVGCNTVICGVCCCKTVVCGVCWLQNRCINRVTAWRPDWQLRCTRSYCRVQKSNSTKHEKTGFIVAVTLAMILSPLCSFATRQKRRISLSLFAYLSCHVTPTRDCYTDVTRLACSIGSNALLAVLGVCIELTFPLRRHLPERWFLLFAVAGSCAPTQRGKSTTSWSNCSKCSGRESCLSPTLRRHRRVCRRASDFLENDFVKTHICHSSLTDS